MRAFILCAGQGVRMRPFTHGLPKASMPFLNLPLLSLGWLYLERMGMSEAALNSHLFPEKLAETVDFLTAPRQSASGAGQRRQPPPERQALSQPRCRAKILFEPESLGSAGGLYHAMQRSALKEKESFFYLNGDSLFFPSSFESLARFKESFRADERAEGMFFAAPPPPEERGGQLSKGGYLWADRDSALRGIGSERKIWELGFSPRWLFCFDGRPPGSCLPGQPRGAGLDGQPRGAGLDGQPRGAGLDGQPRGAGLDSRPSGAGLDSRPSGAGLDSQPRGAGLDGQPSGAGLDSRPHGRSAGAAGALEELKSLKPNELAPLKFSGLAAFKGSFLGRLSEKNLNPEEAHIFHNVIEPLLKEGLFKVFADPGGIVLEGGEKSGLLKASGLAMGALFSEAGGSGGAARAKAEAKAAAKAGGKGAFWASKKAGARSILKSVFQRFDPEDRLAGLQSGKNWTAEHGTPLLAPASVRGLSRLKAEGFAVIGPEAALTGSSFLKESVLGAGVCWRGSLENEIIIKFAAGKSPLKS